MAGSVCNAGPAEPSGPQNRGTNAKLPSALASPLRRSRTIEFVATGVAHGDGGNLPDFNSC